MDIPLYQFRSVFYVQAGADISVASHTGGEYPCSAEEVVVTHHALVFYAKIMRAAEGHFHRIVRIKSLFADV